jgi:hypothetical protein
MLTKNVFPSSAAPISSHDATGVIQSFPAWAIFTTSLLSELTGMTSGEPLKLRISWNHLCAPLALRFQADRLLFSSLGIADLPFAMQQAEGTHPWLYVLSQQDDISKSPACPWRGVPMNPSVSTNLHFFGGWQREVSSLATDTLAFSRLDVCNFLLVVGTWFTSALHGQFLVPCLPLTLTGSAEVTISESFYFWSTNFQKASSIPLCIPEGLSFAVCFKSLGTCCS